MTALKTFRYIGESLAHIDGMPKEQVTMFVDNYAMSQYPKNLSRRKWCKDNLWLFYNHEVIRLKMICGMRS